MTEKNSWLSSRKFISLNKQQTGSNESVIWLPSNHSCVGYTLPRASCLLVSTPGKLQLQGLMLPNTESTTTLVRILKRGKQKGHGEESRKQKEEKKRVCRKTGK